MEILVLALLLGMLALIGWVVIALLRAIFSTTTPRKSAPKPLERSDEIDGMNNGDYYNGPHGYSPMTGYPETQYGSDYDSDAEWDERHE